MGRRVMYALLATALAFGPAESAAAAVTHASIVGHASPVPNVTGPAGAVTPNSGLVDSQIVDLSWSGFLPNAPVYVRMCAVGATDETKCTSPNGDLDHFTAAADGTGAARYKLAEKDFGTFTCDDTHSCVIAMLEDPTNLASGSLVPITFEKPPGACPGATAPPVAGEGATAAAFTMYAWEAAACKLASPINVTYTNDNSFDGMTGFASASPNANFAVTGVSMPSDEASQLAKKSRRFAYAPLSLTGVGIAYNIVDRNGNQVRNLTLSPQIVEEIVTGNLSSFDCPPTATDDQCVHIYGSDPQIRALNPGVLFPDGPVHWTIRAEHSASTLAFTSWLAATDPSTWTYGANPIWPPGDPNPCHFCEPATQGETNAGLAVGAPDSYNPAFVYLALIDTTYAALNDVPMAKIENPGQPAGVAPTAASLAAAVADATKNTDGTITPDYGTNDPNAYAMPMLTYAAVPTNQGWPNFTAQDGKQLASYLRFAAGDGQTQLPSGSYPLPAAVAAQTTTVAGEIPTTEPSPTGGGHNPGGGNTTGTGSGTGPGTGTGFGSGTGGTGGGTSPTGGHGGNGKGGGAKPPLAGALFTTVGSQLSSQTPSAAVPALLALAAIVFLLGPSILLLTRRESVRLGRLRPRRPSSGGSE